LSYLLNSPIIKFKMEKHRKIDCYKGITAMLIVLVIICMAQISVVSSAVFTPQQSLGQNLTAYWKFDETSGTTAKDSFNGHDYTTINGHQNSSGLINYAYTPDTEGGNSSVNLYGQSAMTYNVWIKRIGTFVSNGEIIRTSLANGNNGLLLMSTTNEAGAVNNLSFATFDSTDYHSNWYTDALTLNSWYMLTFIINSSNAYGYVNGVLKNVSALDNFIFADRKIAFFTNPPYFNAYLTNASVDEMGMWNRTLNQTEITQLYNSGTGLTYAPNNDITLNYPSNNQLIVSSSSTLFNCSITNAAYTVSNITLFINGNKNYTQTGTGLELTRSLSFPVGSYNWTCESRDTTNQLSSTSTRYFNVTSLIENSQNYSVSTYETSTESFAINVSYDSSSWINIEGNLIYNGTSYSGTKTGSGNNLIFTRSLNIPIVITDNTLVNFTWSFNLYNSSGIAQINSTIRNQTISKLHLEVCNTTYPVRAYNFTVYDEVNLTRINPFQFWRATFNYGSLTYKQIKSFDNSSGLNEMNICLAPNVTFYTDMILEYGATNYITRNFYLVNNPTNKNTQNISLFLLSSTDSTTFIIKVQDINYLPLSNYYVYVQRYYPSTNEYKTVQVVQTDANGKSVGFYQTETAYYRHIITDENGTIVLTTDKQKIFGESVPYTLTFTIGDATSKPWEDLEEIEGVSYSLGYNKTSKFVNYLYIDSDSGFTQGRLLVQWIKPDKSEIIICNTTSALSSALLSCNLSNYTSGRFVAYGYVTRSAEQLVSSITFEISDNIDTFGKFGLFVAWFIILTSGMIFLWNPTAGIWVLNAAVIFVNIIGLASFSLLWIFAMIAISIIITIYMRQGQL